MKSTTITEREVRNLRANVYIASNGIRRTRQQVKDVTAALAIQTILVLILGILGITGWHQYRVAHDKLVATQEQLRQEAGQAASFREWYIKHPEAHTDGQK